MERDETSPVAERSAIAKAYDEIVHWRKKFFMIPCNAVGKAFVNKLATQLQSFVYSGGKDLVALYNFMVLPTLLLQKPTRDNCGYKEATEHLRRRLDLWDKQDLPSLLDEGRCLQKHALKRRPGGQFLEEKDRVREFGLSMASGQVHRALHTLTEETNGTSSSGVLQMEERITLLDGRSVLVEDLLSEKHPPPQSASEDVLADGDPAQVNPIRFEALTPKLMECIALRCTGSAGPSGLDADTWRRLCTTFKGASTNMCRSLANMARLISTEVVDSVAIEPFIACRLIALDKQPGVRPIGVCEVARRIVAKAILQVVGKDVEEACGFLQKCSGLPAGMEAAVHAMQQMFEDESVEGILLVDAKNAFNNLNREALCTTPGTFVLLSLWFCKTAIRQNHGFSCLVVVSFARAKALRRVTHCRCRSTRWLSFLYCVAYNKNTLWFDRHGSQMTPRVLDVYAHYVTGGTLSAQWVLPMDMTPTAWKRFSL